MFKIVIHACYRRSKAFDSLCLLLYTVMPSLNKISYLILSYLILFSFCSKFARFSKQLRDFRFSCSAFDKSRICAYKFRTFNSDPDYILASRALLVKMLITFEPHGIFGLNFVN